jgi:4-hydroxy-tetrahydrodipicolinate synthase
VHEAGADAALHVCPYYNRPSQEGLYRHFMGVAESCDLPVVLYNIPGRCGVALSAETIARLAAHPNIQAIKDATGSLATAGRVLMETSLAVLSGDDPMTLPLMALGGSGAISILSNLLPEAVADLCRAVDSGDLVDARATHRRLLPLAEALLTLDSNPVPLKAALELVGWDSGAVRLPLVRAAEPVKHKLRAIMEGMEVAVGA